MMTTTSRSTGLRGSRRWSSARLGASLDFEVKWNMEEEEEEKEGGGGIHLPSLDACVSKLDTCKQFTYTCVFELLALGALISLPVVMRIAAAKTRHASPPLAASSPPPSCHPPQQPDSVMGSPHQSASDCSLKPTD